MKRILFTLGGNHLGIGVSRALRAGQEPVHLIATDSSKYHLFQSEADEIHLIPPAQDPAYVDVLSHIAEETGADLVWPMHDAEIERVTAERDAIASRTWLPPVEVVRLTRNKLATQRCLNADGIPVPSSVLIADRSDIVAAIEQFGEIWLRAISGAGGKGAFRTADVDHASMWLEINDGWGDFMAAEVVDCPYERSFEGIWRHGELVASQTLTRLVRGNTGISIDGVKSRTVVQVSAPEKIHELAVAAVSSVAGQPDGIFRVDMLEDPSGNPTVTEVDAGRFGAGGVAFWHQFKVNFAWAYVHLAFEEPLGFQIPAINNVPDETIMIQSINRDPAYTSVSEVSAVELELNSRLAHAAGNDARAVG